MMPVRHALRAILLPGLALLLAPACSEGAGSPPTADAVTWVDTESSADTDTEPSADASAPVETRPSIEIRDFVPGSIAMRRLTRGQYIASVQAIFGADLEVLPPTEVDLRVEGLLTIGAKTAGVTPAGLEGYEVSARQVAKEVLSPQRRSQLLSCEPAVESEADDPCAGEFIAAVAPLVLRRTLKTGEAEAYVALARAAAEQLGEFYAGLEAVLTGWLLSPDFLFIQERADPQQAQADDGPEPGLPLTGDTLASRLSYFFWNRGPDAELLEAAAAGELDTDAGYEAQVERLVGDSVRLEEGVRALFTDLFDLDELAHVDKDPMTFPQFTSAAIEDAHEQTLRTIADHLLVQRADYRDLFTTRKTFMTRHLGPIYDVPVADDWEVHELPEGGERAGILTQVSFLALNARSSRSSPVLRGEFVLDKVLCVKIPPPPADVNFDAVAPGDANAPTARERLAGHRVEPTCAGCHDLLDPIGLAFENFDAIGRFRTQESGFDIETYGDIAGTPYDDIRGFHQVLRDTPAVTRCIVRKLYMHGVGRVSVAAEAELLDALLADFAAADHDFVTLMKSVALSYGFRATSGPAELATEVGQ